MKKTVFLSVIIIIGAGLACKEKPESPTVYECGSTVPTFKNDVGSILVSTCGISGCHDKDVKLAGYDFSNFEGAKEAVNSKNASFLGALQHREGYAYMPLNDAKLPEDLVKRISCWVQNGAPE